MDINFKISTKRNSKSYRPQRNKYSDIKFHASGGRLRCRIKSNINHCLNNGTIEDFIMPFCSTVEKTWWDCKPHKGKIFS